jgi:hypothetical protein
MVVFLLSTKAQAASKPQVTTAFTGHSAHNAVSSHKWLSQALPPAARHKAVAPQALPLKRCPARGKWFVPCTLLALAVHCRPPLTSIPIYRSRYPPPHIMYPPPHCERYQHPAYRRLFRRAFAIADEEVAEGTAAAARGIEIGGGGAIAGACCGADGDADDAADAADAAVDDVDYVDAVGVASTWWDTHRDTHRSYAVVVPDGAAAEPCGAGDEAQAAAHAHAHAHAHAPVPPAMGLLLRLGRHLAGVPAAASVAAAGQGDAVWPLAAFGSRSFASSWRPPRWPPAGAGPWSFVCCRPCALAASPWARSWAAAPITCPTAPRSVRASAPPFFARGSGGSGSREFHPSTHPVS